MYQRSGLQQGPSFLLSSLLDSSTRNQAAVDMHLRYRDRMNNLLIGHLISINKSRSSGHAFAVSLKNEQSTDRTFDFD